MARAYIYDMVDVWASAPTTFTAIKMAVTDTASAAGSLLMDLQVGGTSQFSVSKAGKLTLSMGTLANPAISFTDAGATGFYSPINGVLAYGGTSRQEQFRFSPNGNFRIGYSGEFGFCAADTQSAADLVLTRDAANTLAQRNGVNAQTLRVYNTYTDASNYERLSIGFDTSNTVFAVYTQSAGTGTARALRLGPALTPVIIGTTGNTSVPAGAYLGFEARTTFTSPSAGVVKLESWSGGDFGRLQFGGTTSSFPSLARSGAGIQCRLADNSSLANFECAALDSTVGNVRAGGAVIANFATAIPAGGTAGAGLRVSSTSNFGVFFGSGAPTLSAAKGSLYLRSDGSTTNDRMYVNTDGATTWTAVTTAA